MTEKYSRHINFDNIPNFRDLGGFRAKGGRSVVRRRVFRSAEFSRVTKNDFKRLMGEIRLSAIIDLRSEFEVKRQGVGPISEAGLKYFNISFISDGGEKEANEGRYRNFTNMGQFYVDLVREKGYGRRIIEALKIIAEEKNHPLVFHCAVGKDRTGLLAAVLLSALGVRDENIIEDYALSDSYMKELISHKDSRPDIAEGLKVLPGYFWDAAPESMMLLLTTLRDEYGSTRGYLESMGAEPGLVGRLETALLV
jgi:protein-tyrosine phosphatase